MHPRVRRKVDGGPMRSSTRRLAEEHDAEGRLLTGHREAAHRHAPSSPRRSSTCKRAVLGARRHARRPMEFAAARGAPSAPTNSRSWPTAAEPWPNASPPPTRTPGSSRRPSNFAGGPVRLPARPGPRRAQGQRRLTRHRLPHNRTGLSACCWGRFVVCLLHRIRDGMRATGPQRPLSPTLPGWDWSSSALRRRSRLANPAPTIAGLAEDVMREGSDRRGRAPVRCHPRRWGCAPRASSSYIAVDGVDGCRSRHRRASTTSIVLDIMLPRLNGYDVLQEVRDGVRSGPRC